MKRFAFVVAMLVMVMARATAEPAAPVSPADQKAMRAIILQLYDAYKSRSIDAVMALEQEAINIQAVKFEKQGKVKTAAEYVDAWKGCTQEVLEHRNYNLREIEIEGVEFQRVGKTVVVRGVVPIIATDRVEVAGEGSGMMAALKLTSFTFEQRKDGWHLIGLDLDT